MVKRQALKNLFLSMLLEKFCVIITLAQIYNAFYFLDGPDRQKIELIA